MTQKHFEWAARWIAQARVDEIWSEEETVAMFAFATSLFSKFGPRFSREKFINAVLQETEKNESIRA